MEHILTTKGTMPKPETVTGASIPEYIEIKTATGDTVAFLSPRSDGIDECWISDEQNGTCTLEFQLPIACDKWQYLTDQCRIYAGGKEFVILNPDAIDRKREGKKLTGRIKAHESWVLLGKKFPTVSNDPQNQNPPWSAVIILSGGAPKGGFAQGSAGNALSWILEGTGWTVGTVDVTGTYDLESEKESVLANINAIQQKWGGILIWDSVNKTVSLRDEEAYQPYTGYQIRYAKNLKGITRTDDYDIVTRLYPFGENDLNIANVNGGLLYLDNNTYSTEILEGIWPNQDLTDQNQLKAQAEKQLAVMCRPRHNYKTEILDLRSLPGYGHETFKRSDMVDLYDEDFGADARVRIIRYKYNIFQPWLCDMELGDPLEKISATVAQTILMAKFYKNVVKPNESFQNLLKAIINTKATEINGASGDYTLVDGVSTWFDRDEQGNLTGKLLRITPQGLIISYDGGQTWKLAISGEGFHADAGWVGKLNAGVVTVGAGTTFEAGYDPSTKNATFSTCPSNGKYKKDDIMIPAVGFVSGAKTFYAGEIYQALADGDGIAFDSAHWAEASLLSSWKKTGTTTIDGGQIAADTIAATQLKGDTAMVNFLNALNITAKYVSANGLTAGTINSDNVNVKSNDGNLNIANAEITIKHNNGTKSKLNNAGLKLYESLTEIPYVTPLDGGNVTATTSPGWSGSNGNGYTPSLYTIQKRGRLWVGKAAKTVCIPTIGEAIRWRDPDVYRDNGVTEAACQVYSITDVATTTNRTSTLPDQSGMSANQVKLDSGASGTDDAYNGTWITVDGVSRKISDYTGSTRVAIVEESFDADNLPQLNDAYIIETIGGVDIVIESWKKFLTVDGSSGYYYCWRLAFNYLVILKG